MTTRVALISGCASERGIGYATARRLAILGWDIVALDIAGRDLVRAATKLEELGHKALPIVCDVTSCEQVRSAVTKTEKEFGRIDALVNNAGITAPAAIDEITEEEWERIFSVNIKGVFLLTQAALQVMRANRYGRVVNVSSVSAKRGGGILGGAHYSAAKAAVLGFTRAVAREVAADGITCNAVAPGLIDTDITAGRLSPERCQALIDDIPVGRIGRPDDVAVTIAFLCSEDASYITGEVVDINGGSHID